MKILLLSDVQRKGGAGIAAHRLAKALIGAGHDVRWATPHPDADSDIPTDHLRELTSGQRLARRIALTLYPARNSGVNLGAIRRRLHQLTLEFKPDVVNVHNLHGANLPAMLPAELSRTVPVVWTLHDMWAFTGTCAYAMECRKFESGCDASCAMAGVYPASPPSRIKTRYEQRVRALRQAGPIAFVTPSKWLAEEARRSMLQGHEVHAFPNCVELDQFIPVDRVAARQALGLPTNRPVLVSTASPGDPRKGAAIVHEAMHLLDRPNTIVLQLGGAKIDAQGHWDHRVLTGMHDPRLLRLAYSAADAHVLPTLADNLPNTLLEAAACGVPSIASDIGGVGEAIDPRQTGWLVPANDPKALAAMIGQVIDRPQDAVESCRRACRQFAEANFSPTMQAKRYTELMINMQAARREAA